MTTPKYTIHILAWSNSLKGKPYYVFSFDRQTEEIHAYRKVDQLISEGLKPVAAFLADEQGKWAGQWGRPLNV